MQIRFLSLFLRLLAMAITSLAASMSLAQIPQTINYQGYITNSASQPVNAAVSVTFRLYTTASGGSPVWTETQNGIGVANGVFTVVLGSASALGLPFNVPYFLSLQVNADAEMATRQPLSAVPYSLRALSADSVAASVTIPAAQLTGTLASSQFTATQLLPTTACAPNQFSQWNGTAWVCAAGTGTSTTSDVTGNLTMVNSTASAGNVLKGGALFIHNNGGDSTFLGLSAGNSSNTGTYNTGSGALALGQVSNGYGNSAHGTWAMRDNTSGFFNAAGGAFALLKNTSGNSNTAFGNDALAALTSGNNNIAIGAEAGTGIVTGSGNILIGHGGNNNDTGIVRIGRVNTHVKAFMAGIRGVSPGIADALPVVIDSNGQLGTGAAAGGGIVSITAGTGLTGGTITSAGTIGLAATQLLPVSPCAANQSPQWNGSAWTCASGTTGAQGPIGPTGPIGPQGPAGSVDAVTNLTLPASTASEGNILKAGTRFIHNYGFSNTFIGKGAGNFAMTGSGNAGFGENALAANTSGAGNTATGRSALITNTTGDLNTANGGYALNFNTTGSFNTATGNSALLSNTTGANNTATGALALQANTIGGNNTASGNNALRQNSSGNFNTADGASALQNNTSGFENTAIGASALFNNTTGDSNTAVGKSALQNNTTGYGHTAGGANALSGNTSGLLNTAFGGSALRYNTTGGLNTATGKDALLNNTSGSGNTANGLSAMMANTSGVDNIAIGVSALWNNTIGNRNTVVGRNAMLFNTAGDYNIALGYEAGSSLTTGSRNINIGNLGVAAESNTIRIGDANQTRTFISGIRSVTTAIANAIPVLIDGNGQLGTASSSRRFKDNIADMDAASSALMRLRPVTFYYKTDQHSAGRSLQYGLIAEEVADVYPDLVARSADGHIETVMYQFLPPMLLNEVQKQHRAIEDLQSKMQAKVREIDALKGELNAIKKKLGLD